LGLIKHQKGAVPGGKSLRPGSYSFGGTIMPPATIMVSAMIAAASLLVV